MIPKLLPNLVEMMHDFEGLPNLVEMMHGFKAASQPRRNDA